MQQKGIFGGNRSISDWSNKAFVILLRKNACGDTKLKSLFDIKERRKLKDCFVERPKCTSDMTKVVWCYLSKVSTLLFFTTTLYFFSRIHVRSRHLHQMSYSSCHPVREWNMYLPLSYLRCVLKKQIGAYAVFLRNESDKLLKSIVETAWNTVQKSFVLSYREYLYLHSKDYVLWIHLMFKWWALMMYSLCSRHLKRSLCLTAHAGPKATFLRATAINTARPEGRTGLKYIFHTPLSMLCQTGWHRSRVNSGEKGRTIPLQISAFD